MKTGRPGTNSNIRPTAEQKREVIDWEARDVLFAARHVRVDTVRAEGLWDSARCYHHGCRADDDFHCATYLADSYSRKTGPMQGSARHGPSQRAVRTATVVPETLSCNRRKSISPVCKTPLLVLMLRHLRME